MIRTDHGRDKFCIKAFIITMMNNQQSVVSTRKLLRSMKYPMDRSGKEINDPSWVQPFIMNATTPDTIDSDIEFNFPIAKHIWIGCSSFLIFIKHVIDNALFVLIAKIYYLKRNSQIFSNLKCIVAVFYPRTFITYCNRFIIPVTHK